MLASLKKIFKCFLNSFKICFPICCGTTVIFLYNNNKLIKKNIKEKDYLPNGLINCSSNCYINSVIQSLFFLIKFRKTFLNKKYTKRQPASLELQNIFIGLLTNKNKPYDPSYFINVISKNTKLFSETAGDPSDLILYLLDKLHEEDKIEAIYNDKEIDEKDENEVYNSCIADIDKSIISDLFYGFYGEESTCLKCMQTFYIIEPKFLIEINVEEISKKLKHKNSIKIGDYFNNIYTTVNKKYFICPNCGKQEANIKSYIKDFPQIVVIILKNTNITFKINIEKEFKFKNNIYILNGVSTIAYRPTKGFYGHSIAYCLHNNQYYLLNDTTVKKVNFEDFKKKEHYILFYSK